MSFNIPLVVPLPRVSESLRVRRDSGWQKVREEGHCRMCLRPATVRKLTRHHLVPQAYFNCRGGTGTQWRYLRDVDANVVGLCRDDHDLIHSIEWGEFAKIFLRNSLTQEEIAFMIQVRGLEWVNRFYPSVLGSYSGEAAVLAASMALAQMKKVA